MRPRTILLTTVLLAVGTGALIQYREPLLLELGLEQWDPTYMRAIDLAKSARSLDRYHTNYFAINNRLELEGSKIDSEGWTAERVDEETFLVRYRSRVEERKVEYDFEVDVAYREVFLRKNDPTRPDYDPNEAIYNPSMHRDTSPSDPGEGDEPATPPGSGR